VVFTKLLATAKSLHATGKIDDDELDLLLTRTVGEGGTSPFTTAAVRSAYRSADTSKTLGIKEAKWVYTIFDLLTRREFKGVSDEERLETLANAILIADDMRTDDDTIMTYDNDDGDGGLLRNDDDGGGRASGGDDSNGGGPSGGDGGGDSDPTRGPDAIPLTVLESVGATDAADLETVKSHLVAMHSYLGDDEITYGTILLAHASTCLNLFASYSVLAASRNIGRIPSQGERAARLLRTVARYSTLLTDCLRDTLNGIC